MDWRARQGIDSISSHLQVISGNDATCGSHISHNILNQQDNKELKRKFEETKRGDNDVIISGIRSFVKNKLCSYHGIV